MTIKFIIKGYDLYNALKSYLNNSFQVFSNNIITDVYFDNPKLELIKNKRYLRMRCMADSQKMIFKNGQSKEEVKLSDEDKKMLRGVH